MGVWEAYLYCVGTLLRSKRDEDQRRKNDLAASELHEFYLRSLRKRYFHLCILRTGRASAGCSPRAWPPQGGGPRTVPPSPAPPPKQDWQLFHLHPELVVTHEREGCWDECGQKQGKCDYCGAGYCCRKNWPDKSGGCDGEIGLKGMHVCARLESESERYIRETELLIRPREAGRGGVGVGSTTPGICGIRLGAYSADSWFHVASLGLT